MEGVSEEKTQSREALHVPSGVEWMQEVATGIDAQNQVVTVGAGRKIHYDGIASEAWKNARARRESAPCTDTSRPLAPER